MRNITAIGLTLVALLMAVLPANAVGPPDEIQVSTLDAMLGNAQVTVEFVFDAKYVARMATRASEYNYSDFESGADLIRQDAMGVVQRLYRTKPSISEPLPQHRLPL